MEDFEQSDIEGDQTTEFKEQLIEMFEAAENTVFNFHDTLRHFKESNSLRSPHHKLGKLCVDARKSTARRMHPELSEEHLNQFLRNKFKQEERGEEQLRYLEEHWGNVIENICCSLRRSRDRNISFLEIDVASIPHDEEIVRELKRLSSFETRFDLLVSFYMCMLLAALVIQSQDDWAERQEEGSKSISKKEHELAGKVARGMPILREYCETKISGLNLEKIED